MTFVEKMKPLLVLLTLLLSACCTKKECIGGDEIYEIAFYNFTGADLDTITIFRYHKNTGFQTVIDSFITSAEPSGDYLSLYIYDRIHTSLDYKINIQSTGQVFTLTDFVMVKKVCNSTLIFETECDYYTALESYRVNGKIHYESSIKIFN